ncbi:hypothetical protein C8Q78DRAFT_522087 [Trametes maxima]|nr:hypothetical protein C8Q78DRAFT_522087 [Trametes maxima]
MSYQAPGTYPQKAQPTAPTRRARYRRGDPKWQGIPYKQWEWVVLTHDIGLIFRAGELVCLLDGNPVRISPTETVPLTVSHSSQRPQQSTQWQKLDIDTEYRIGKYVKETKMELWNCEDSAGSISHLHVSNTKEGKPVTDHVFKDNDLVYLLPTFGSRIVPTHYIPYVGEGRNLRLPIPTHAMGLVVQRTSRKGGVSYARSSAPPPSTASRTLYVVSFPVQTTSCSWVECSIPISNAYFRRATPNDGADAKEKEVNTTPPSPRVAICTSERVLRGLPRSPFQPMLSG